MEYKFSSSAPAIAITGAISSAIMLVAILEMERIVGPIRENLRARYLLVSGTGFAIRVLVGLYYREAPFALRIISIANIGRLFIQAKTLIACQ